TADGELRIKPNNTNDSTLAGVFGYSLTPTTYARRGTADAFSNGYNLARANANNAFYFTIGNYANTTYYKSLQFYGYGVDTTSNSSYINFAGGYALNTAVSSLVFSNSGGNFSTGTVLLYGVK
ncbi:MAG: hypothetical protein WCR20_11535, partial [Verrucomicrobiota bacterium]